MFPLIPRTRHLWQRWHVGVNSGNVWRVACLCMRRAPPLIRSRLSFNLGGPSPSLRVSPVLHRPFPSLPINEAADTPDLLTQLLQDLFFATNLQQLESRGMHVNFVCVIW